MYFNALVSGGEKISYQIIITVTIKFNEWVNI